ncbi:MAG: replication associated protein [Wigfec virus K19_598]|nr:MAG: replication associated protein [Wigfec virus K19_598]
MNPQVRFNFNRKTVFLTYAQCSFDKEEYKQWWTTVPPEGKGQDLVEYVIAEEEHQDGNPHMHVYLKFAQQVHTRDPRYFDYEGHHPHIKTCNKSAGIEAIKKYCMKNGKYIKSDSVVILGKREALMKDLLEEGLTKDFVRRNPMLMTMNFSSIKSWVEFAGAKKEEFKELSMPKKRHLWVYGPSNTGKSFWLRAYRSMHTASEIPPNDDWSGINLETDLLWADEYKGGLTIQKLNLLCDGCIKLNTKGGSTRIGYPRVVICSNFSIRDCYSKAGELEIGTLRNRFIEFDLSVDDAPSFKTYATREL